MHYIYNLFGYCNNKKLDFTQEDLIKSKQNLKKTHTLNKNFYLPDLDEITDKIRKFKSQKLINEINLVKNNLTTPKKNNTIIKDFISFI